MKPVPVSDGGMDEPIHPSFLYFGLVAEEKGGGWLAGQELSGREREHSEEIKWPVFSF
jgi:hypothetical protein